MRQHFAIFRMAELLVMLRLRTSGSYEEPDEVRTAPNSLLNNRKRHCFEQARAR